ncbi:MAG TPA: DUF1844 domain-containing protein [Roseimicrobium sp.]|nr:DUF1844 domain-containing protein [Roseimicrobium sp.]
MKSPFPEDNLGNATREEIMSALFSHLVVQHANMALMLLGKIPHPETNEVVMDLEGAKSFIDQLEMLEFKTKGNLTLEETALLHKSLNAARMAFVDAIDSAADQ